MEAKPLILAAVIIGALIAAAILIVFRWQISAGPPSRVYRLDRWNGTVILCYEQSGGRFGCEQVVQ